MQSVALSGLAAPWRGQSSDAIGGNQSQSKAIRGNQRQSEAINQRQSDVVQCLGGSKTITPSREARLTSLVHRVCGRVDGAVVGVYMAPSAVSMRASGLTCGERAVAPWWARACKAGGACRSSPRTCCTARCRQWTRIGRVIPVGGVSI